MLYHSQRPAAVAAVVAYINGSMWHSTLGLYASLLQAPVCLPMNST